jgi:hypothetical protein
MRTMMAAALCALPMATNAHAAIKEEPVTYQDGTTTLKGFVVYADAVQGKHHSQEEKVHQCCEFAHEMSPCAVAQHSNALLLPSWPSQAKQCGTACS